MRNKLLRFVVFYLIWAALVVGVFMFTLNSGIQSVEAAPFSADFGGTVTIPFVVMFVGLGAPWILFWLVFNRKPNWTKDVLANGKQAPATILGVGDTGVSYGNVDFVVTLRLQVQPADEPAFETTLETTVSRVDIPRAGDTYVVKYDPNNKAHIMLLTQEAVAAGYGTMPTASTMPNVQMVNLNGDPNKLVQQLMDAAARNGNVVNLQSLGKDVAQELASLAQLHKSGDLSDAQYEAAKQKLLA